MEARQGRDALRLDAQHDSRFRREASERLHANEFALSKKIRKSYF
jgi:hypothetical protein